MPFGRKLMVIAFLSLGVAVTIVGAVRTSVLVRVFVIGEVVPDPTYGVGYTLSNIESGLAIIGTCGPTINRSRRYTMGTRAHDTFQEIDGNTKSGRDSPGENGGVELTSVGDGRSGERRVDSDEHLVITKTVAWRVDASQPDSNSAHEHDISTPHTVL
ncbi:hypothetical protein E8E11_009610 [Didymella keratinophila]|nr:hypothetical protein E8E11_009610 [Didymella keratinophila]